MKEFFKRFFVKRVTDEALAAECSKAASFFVQERLRDAPSDKKIEALNLVATGFYMGHRNLEKNMGLTKEKVKAIK